MEFTIEPLFDIEVETPRYVHQLDPLEIDNGDETSTCKHCGDTVRSGTFSFNHQRVFNGWCAQRLFCNHRVNDIQDEWMNSHGFETVDEHDEENWV